MGSQTPGEEARGMGTTREAAEGKVTPQTIFRHGFAVYPSMALLAGMQLDLFTPLGNAPMAAPDLAAALGVRAEKLRPLLYALAAAEILEALDDHRFANTPEADRFLVRGRPGYMGGAHEHWADLWAGMLRTAETIRTGMPQAKHDFAAMDDVALTAFLRGLHPTALATGRRLAETQGMDRFQRLLDVGGGSGGLAIGACERCHGLSAAVVELPRVAPITRAFVEEAGLRDRIEVLAADAVDGPLPQGQFDVAALRFFIQVLGPEQARRALRTVGRALAPDGTIFVIGRVLDDSRLMPWETVTQNLALLNMFDEGQAYTEGEHRAWLAEVGFVDVAVEQGFMPSGVALVAARKVG
jgi:SAM-dependent methyltransferase